MKNLNNLFKLFLIILAITSCDNTVVKQEDKDDISALRDSVERYPESAIIGKWVMVSDSILKALYIDGKLYRKEKCIGGLDYSYEFLENHSCIKYSKQGNDKIKKYEPYAYWKYEDNWIRFSEGINSSIEDCFVLKASPGKLTLMIEIPTYSGPDYSTPSDSDIAGDHTFNIIDYALEP